MRQAEEVLQTMRDNRKTVEFIPTGFQRLDVALDGGFLKKEVIILGAFTGIGKSMLAGQMFHQIASHGFKSAYFSLEISTEMLVSRLVGQLANIKPTRIMNGIGEPEEIDTIAKAKAHVTMYNGLMDFYDNLYLLTELEDAITKNKYEFVVIDFIQNMLVQGNMDEYTRLSLIAVRLQRLAKKVGCAILVLSQLSNRVGSRNDQVVEYKGSGAIAMVADLGFFLQRDQPILDPFGSPIGNQPVKLALRKNRRGISGTVWEFEFVHPGGLIQEKP